MCKKLNIALFTIMFLIVPCLCIAYPRVCIDNLINNPKSYANNEVIIEGEVIGEPMVRGKGVWINVNDGNYAIGVWGDKEIINKIKTYGNYHYKGDKIRVAGKFHYNCKEHGGDVDIHYEKIDLIEKGHNIQRQVNKRKFVTAIVLIIITTILSTIYIINRKAVQL